MSRCEKVKVVKTCCVVLQILSSPLNVESQVEMAEVQNQTSLDH